MFNKKSDAYENAQPRYEYLPVEERLTSEDGEDYVSYGISARDAEKEIAFISDVSTNAEEVARLAKLCTERKLSPEHLRDVIEDFLANESMVLI